MDSKLNISCQEHENSPYIGFCTTCGKALCIDCMFEHTSSFKDHKIEKLAKLKEKYTLELKEH